MKKITFCLSFLLICASLQAQQVKTPSPSPTQTVKQDFALSTIEIVYSRPSMKGRMIFGEKSPKTVVPFGELWRTGANRATKITFGEDVKLAGNAIKAGEYALYTVPGKMEWEIVLNKGVNNGGTAGYKTEEDVLRFKVKPMTLPVAMETFTIQFANLTASTCEIHILWDKTAVAIPVSAEIDSRIMANLNNAMNKDNRPYYQAATYYFENGKDLNQALTWANKAVEQEPEAYWIYHLKAKIQAKAGDKKAAAETANKSIEIAKREKDNNYVRLNEELLAGLK
jgi:tetratricopeptide (TPR) repeat protein